MWWAGSAKVEDGITVNLSGLNGVEVVANHTATEIGAGVRCGDIYLKFDAINLSVVSGRVIDVGVAGLILDYLYSCGVCHVGAKALMQVASRSSRQDVALFAIRSRTLRQEDREFNLSMGSILRYCRWCQVPAAS